MDLVRLKNSEILFKIGRSQKEIALKLEAIYMENYITLLLLIVPGFVAQTIFINLNQSEKKVDNFSLTIQALTYSIFILLFNYIILSILGYINTNDFASINKSFININFIVKYIIITILTSFYIGYCWNMIKPIYFHVINIIRKSESKNKLLNSPSMLLSCLDDGRDHLLSIEKDGKSLDTGFLNRFDNIEGNIKNISLVGQNDIEGLNISSYPIKRTYYTDEIKIIEYDIEYDIEEFTTKHKNISFLAFVVITSIFSLCLYLIHHLFSLLHF